MENQTLPTNWLAPLSNARSASRWVTLVQQALGYAALLSLDGIQTTSISGIGNGTERFWNPAPLMQNYMIKSVKMTKKSIFRDQFSWKVRTFAQNLCENGLHLGKERALCTRFAPSLSHAFSQRHHFILLNFSAELLPRTRFYEQNQISIGAAHHSADSTIADLGL